MWILVGVLVLVIVVLATFLNLVWEDAAAKEKQAIQKGYAYYHHANKNFTWETEENIAERVNKRNSPSAD